MTSAENEETDGELTTDEILSHLEFGLWTAVVLIPILYYVNGAAVSQDQWVMRAMLVGIAYCGAPAMRWIRWRRGRKSNEATSAAATSSAEGSGIGVKQT